MKTIRIIVLSLLITSSAALTAFAAYGPSQQSHGLPGVKSPDGYHRYASLDEAVAAAGLGVPTDVGTDPVLNEGQQVSYTFFLDEKTAMPSVSSAGSEYMYNPEGFPRLYLDHEGVGRYYYRCYTTTDGWGPWCNSKEVTPVSSNAARVQAIQIRVKGYVSTLSSLYYKTVLNDGTVLDWAKDGQTSGTVGTDKYIVALGICVRSKQNAPGPTAYVMCGNKYEGAYAAPGGEIKYSTADGHPHTGWGWLSNRQYRFQDGNLVRGWFYADGYKYYAGDDGAIVTDYEPVMGLQGSYVIKYNKSTRTLYVMANDPDGGGYIIPYKTFMSSCGPLTPIGTFSAKVKYDWKYMHDSGDGSGDIYCQKLTRFHKGFLMHSLLYYRAPSPFTLDAINYNHIDDAASGGCIRLRAGDANWIYVNVPLGTPVTIYQNVYEKGPVEKDCIEQVIPRDQNYDPTDPEALAVIAAGQTQQTADAAAAAQAAVDLAAADDASMGITATE